MDIQQGILKVKAFYIKARANKATPDEARQLTTLLRDNFDGVEFETIKELNNELAHLKTTKEKTQKYRENFYKERYVRVSYLDGGWYSFSPSGHKYYSKSDEITVHGYDKLIKELEDRGLFSISTRGYVGKGGYIGLKPKKFFD